MWLLAMEISCNNLYKKHFWSINIIDRIVDVLCIRLIDPHRKTLSFLGGTRYFVNNQKWIDGNFVIIMDVKQTFLFKQNAHSLSLITKYQERFLAKEIVEPLIKAVSGYKKKKKEKTLFTYRTYGSAVPTKSSFVTCSWRIHSFLEKSAVFQSISIFRKKANKIEV